MLLVSHCEIGRGVTSRNEASSLRKLHDTMFIDRSIMTNDPAEDQ